MQNFYPKKEMIEKKKKQKKLKEEKSIGKKYRRPIASPYQNQRDAKLLRRIHQLNVLNTKEKHEFFAGNFRTIEHDEELLGY